MVKVLAGILVAAVLALAGTGYALRKQMQKAQELRVLNGALEQALVTQKRLRGADSKAAATARAQLKAAAEQKERQDDAIAKALAANPDWAGQRVPDAVIDALGVR